MKKFEYAFLSFAQKVQQVCEDSRGFTRYIWVRLNVCVIIADFSATNIQSAIYKIEDMLFNYFANVLYILCTAHKNFINK